MFTSIIYRPFFLNQNYFVQKINAKIKFFVKNTYCLYWTSEIYSTYSTRSVLGQQSPVSSEAATTARASSIVGNHGDTNIHSLRRSTLGRKNHSNTNTLNNRDATPVLNPLYNHGGDLLSPSPSNDNVTFRERKDYSHLGFTYLGEQSPVETTTEL